MKVRAHPHFTASELALVVSLFTGLTLAWTWPLAATIGRVLPSDLGDPLLNTWILGWAADRSAHGFRGLWNAPIFFPYPNTLAYSEHLLGILPVTLPVQWLTHNPVAAYDVAFLFSYVLAGAGMYVLARSVCGSSFGTRSWHGSVNGPAVVGDVVGRRGGGSRASGGDGRGQLAPDEGGQALAGTESGATTQGGTGRGAGQLVSGAARASPSRRRRTSAMAVRRGAVPRWR